MSSQAVMIVYAMLASPLRAMISTKMLTVPKFALCIRSIPSHYTSTSMCSLKMLNVLYALRGMTGGGAYNMGFGAIDVGIIVSVCYIQNF